MRVGAGWMVTVIGLVWACTALSSAGLCDEGDAAACAPSDRVVAYLQARSELAPVQALSEQELRAAVASQGAGAVELFGAIAGIASCAAAAEGTECTLALDLEGGGSVSLRAGEGFDELRVGELLCVIAQLAPGTAGLRNLRVAAWVRTWDLPEGSRPGAEADTGGEATPPANPDVQPPALEPPGDQGPGQPPALSATGAYPLDAIQVWKAWALEHNPRLTDQQATDIVGWVLQYAQKYDINHKLIFSVIKWESWFDPGCVSHSGAVGLMQLMPGTARYLGVDPWNVQQNIEGGVHYLAEQLAEYTDRPNAERVILALACYNAGPNAVKRAGGVPNITETQRYVRKVSSTFRELHAAGFP